MRIALCDINKKGVEIGERQNKCHDDIYVNVIFFGCYFVHCRRSRQGNLNVYVTAIQEEVQEW